MIWVIRVTWVIWVIWVIWAVLGILGAMVIMRDTQGRDHKNLLRKQFSDKNLEKEALNIGTKTLQIPICEHEVRTAIKKLKSNKSTGPDKVSNELIKCAGPQFVKIYIKIINESFKVGQTIDNLGEGLLSPIQKSNKTAGPIKHLRPIILLNDTRKILSAIALSRVEEKIDF